MSKNQRNIYSSEFKLSAIELATESDQSIAQTARDLGVNDNTLHNWINNSSKSNDMSKSSECHFEEVRKLRRELAIVKQERDLLKKAAAYFAKESQ
jgi:transposase